jgi:putative ABC transport system ATP-binding protein
MQSSGALVAEPADIVLRDVTRRYQLGDETIHAVSHLSLEIRQGEFVAITGPSGSGKSTLANLIGGLDSPDEGTIAVGGLGFSTAGDKELSHYRSHSVGFVFQAFNLQAHLSVIENTTLPLIIAGVDPVARKERAQVCLGLVGLLERADQMTHQLSGGQRQRVAIARALANQPRILIADEPTGNLDQENGRMVLEYLVTLNRDLGVTLILITHDPLVANTATRVLEVVDGIVTERRGS